MYNYFVIVKIKFSNTKLLLKGVKVMDIGTKIKALRLKNNLTLKELASRCELTTGFLSQLEHNVSSPSIQTLENIIEALGSSLKDFFNDTEENKMVFNKDDFYIHETQD